jgi:hypothetical protein
MDAMNEATDGRQYLVCLALTDVNPKITRTKIL